MTALATRSELPTPQLPVPTVTDQRLLQSLLGAGFFRDKISAGLITASHIPALRQMRAQLDPVMAPAPLPEAAAVLERLFAHYWRPDMPASTAEGRLDDWYDDIGELPLDVIIATARDWRRSDAKFAPTPGQFLAKAKRYHEPRKLARWTVDRVLEALEPVAA